MRICVSYCVSDADGAVRTLPSTVKSDCSFYRGMSCCPKILYHCGLKRLSICKDSTAQVAIIQSFSPFAVVKLLSAPRDIIFLVAPTLALHYL